MKKHFNTWEETMGNRLQNLQPEPAFDAWERIEAELEDKPKRMAWYWIAATVALLAGPAAYIGWQAQQGLGEPASTLATQTNEPAATTTLPGSDATIPAPKGGLHTLPPSAAIAHETPKASPDPRTAPTGMHQQQPEPGEDEAPSAHSAIASRTSPEAGTAAGNTRQTEPIASTSAQGAAGQDQREVAHVTPSYNTAAGTAAAGYTSSTAIAESKEVSLASISARKPAGFPLHYTINPPVYTPSHQVDEHSLAALEKPVEPEEKEKKSLARLWIEAMPTWSYRRIEPSQADGVVITAMDQQSPLASSRMGGQLGAGVSYPLGKKLQWKSGAYYWYQQQRWSYTYHNGKAASYVARMEASNNISMTPQFNEQTQNVAMNLHNLGVSTGLSLQLPTKFAASALETRIHAQYNAIQEINSLLSLGYSIEAKLDENTRIILGPSVQVQLNNNQNTSPHFEEKPVSAGLQMGVIF